MPFTGAGPMSQALLAGTVMRCQIDRGRQGEQPQRAGDADRRAHSLVAERADHEGIGLPIEAFSAGGLMVGCTPDAIVARLQKACQDAVASDGYKAATEKLNATAKFLPGPELRCPTRIPRQCRGGEEGGPGAVVMSDEAITPPPSPRRWCSRLRRCSRTVCQSRRAQARAVATELAGRRAVSVHHRRGDDNVCYGGARPRGGCREADENASGSDLADADPRRGLSPA